MLKIADRIMQADSITLGFKNIGISSEPEFTTDDFAKNRQAWPRIPRKNAL
jgi:hypothetical protein